MFGGTTVYISGTNLELASSVSFGAAPAMSFVVVSPTLIVATTPSGVPGTVDVTVTTPGGTATLVNGYTYVAPPD